MVSVFLRLRLVDSRNRVAVGKMQRTACEHSALKIEDELKVRGERNGRTRQTCRVSRGKVLRVSSLVYPNRIVCSNN